MGEHSSPHERILCDTLGANQIFYHSKFHKVALTLSRLLQDVNLSSGAQNQALESLKVQLSRAQAQLVKEREEHKAEKLNFVERESLLRSEEIKLTDSTAVLQRQVVAEQNRSRELQVSLQSAQREIQTLRREHEEYKQRAAGILQVNKYVLRETRSH